MKFLIIDSHIKQSNEVRLFIQKHFGMSSKIVESNDYINAVNLIKSEAPQVILSTSVVNGKSIFSLIEQFAPNKERSWFLLDKISGQAIKAIRLGVSGICDFKTEQDFLLKTLNKVSKNLKTDTNKTPQILDTINQTLIIQSHRGFREINLSSILFIEQNTNGVKFKVDSGEILTSNQNLMLASNSLLNNNFKVLTTSIIVNVNRVNSIIHLKSGCKIQFDNKLQKNIYNIDKQKLEAILGVKVFS